MADGPILASCGSNAVNALMKRHLAPPTNRIRSFVCRLLEGNVRFQRSFKTQFAVHYEEWRTRKSKVKVERIEKSVAEDRVDFTRVQFMIKKEVNCQVFAEPVTIKKARGIQFAINERSAYEFVDYFDAFSSALVEESAREFYLNGIKMLLCYSAKMSHADISRFATESEQERAQYVYSLIDERDGKNWDANIQVPHREALIRVYAECGGQEFARYVSSGVHITGRFFAKGWDCSIKYEVNGTVKSGHGDTSCGNGALNREVSAQALASLPKHLRPVRVRGLIMGDDYIAWLYFSHAVDPDELSKALNEAEAQLGIHPERGLFSRIEHASFISLGFFRAHNMVDIIALPKVGRLLCRLFWTVTELRGRDPRRLASGIAASFYPLFNTMPLMREFLSHHMQVPPLDVADCNHYYEWAEIGLTRLPAPINWDENALIKYGFPFSAVVLDMPAEQGAGFIHHPLVDRMYQVDVSDPMERKGCLSSGEKGISRSNANDDNRPTVEAEATRQEGAPAEAAPATPT